MLHYVRTLQDTAEEVLRLREAKADRVPGAAAALKTLSKGFKELQALYTSRVEDAVRTDAARAYDFEHEALLLLRELANTQREMLKAI